MQKEPDYYRLAIIDDDVNIQNTNFGGISEFTAEGKRFQCKFINDPAAFVEGLTYLDEVADAILLDINFDGASQQHLKGIPGPKRKAGVRLIKILKRIDPIVPVLIFSSISDQNIAFEAGLMQADDFISKGSVTDEVEAAQQRGDTELLELGRRIRRAWVSSIQNPIYDPDHLKIADNFAKSYEDDEQQKVSTVAYYHLENELIVSTIKEILSVKADDEPLNILDLGCGTGRIECLIASMPEIAKTTNVTAIDFSPNMLRGLRSNKVDLPNLTVLRGPVEAFCLNDCGLEKNYYDLIIAGFGFLSYVNYKFVLSPVQKGLGGLGLMLRPGGKLIASVYNENSLIYDVIAGSQLTKEEISIAAVVDVNAGILRVGAYKILCEAFSISRLCRLIRQAGLFVSTDSVMTFPSQHLSINNKHCQEGRLDGFVRGGDPQFPLGFFNQQLYEQDIILSKYLKNRGHYIVAVASRQANP
jgi:SAM-dependent methyltransferase